MLNKYEKLTDAIKEAVPSISKIVKCDVCAGDKLNLGRDATCPECDGAGEWRETRSIGLEDVLVAIEKRNIGKEFNHQDTDNYYFCETLSRWIWHKPLHLQSNETLQFLADMLI